MDSWITAECVTMRTSFSKFRVPGEVVIAPLQRQLPQSANFYTRGALSMPFISISAILKAEKPSVPLFSSEEVISRLKEVSLGSQHQKKYMAMYSSIIGGITTDPTFMLIPLDDHMVHRGHGVFDTALIINGHLYELDAHLDRLLRSASMAKIHSPFSRAVLREILVATTAASNCQNGSLRYWMSVGPGNFGLSPSGCKNSAFYAVVLGFEHEPCEEGALVVTSSVPMKAPEFATMKNVNYLPNALSMMEAESNGARAAIWVDEQGYVAEGPNMNVAFVTKDQELVMPPFNSILAGCTAQRAFTLARNLINENGDNENIHQGNAQILKSVCVRNISVTEAKNAAEMMLLGSGLPIMPIIKWDDQQIGNGKPGPVTLALQSLLRNDMLNGPLCMREPIPYLQ